MAKVVFNGVKIEYNKLKIYVDRRDFKQFIFQYVNYDAERWKDQFMLIAYPMNNNDEVINSVKIELDLWDRISYSAKDRVEFGNIPLTRYQITDILKPDINDTLYFRPEEYEEYVAYRISTNPNVKMLTDLEAKPSPPAPPPPEDRKATKKGK